MLLTIVLLQIIVAGVVLFVLRALLERELVLYAIERFEGYRSGAEDCVKDVTVLVGCSLSQALEARLKSVIKAKFPLAACSVMVSKDIGGGVVARIDGEILDLSVASRVRSLWGKASA